MAAAWASSTFVSFSSWRKHDRYDYDDYELWPAMDRSGNSDSLRVQ